MGKTIMFIASMDTKREEINYAAEVARKNGCTPLILDASAKEFDSTAGDIHPLEILSYNGITAAEFAEMDKGLRIETMSEAIVTYAKKLYAEKRFDGVMSVGGGQNSKLAANAMKELPYGLPKLIVSTLASGNRIFDTYIGNKDILIMHSVVDIAGLNSITKMIINNAVAAMAGMVEAGIGLTLKKDCKRVAATMLGITTKGTVAVMNELEKDGYETIGFHANGVGGACMEKLLQDDYFDLILDMNLHEITCEFLGGFCMGAYRRLEEAAKRGVPQIVVPGAIDVLDYGITLENRETVMKEVRKRQYYYHNSNIVHSKITQDEAVQLAEVIGSRLNEAKGALKVMIPLEGFCEAGGEGKALFQKETDLVFINTLKKVLDPGIDYIEVEANINDRKFSDAVLEEAKKMLAQNVETKTA